MESGARIRTSKGISMTSVIRKRLLATTIIAGAVMSAAPAFAQNEAAAQPAAAGGTCPDGTAGVDCTTTGTTADSTTDVVVTGSRIPQPNLESASPVTIVNAAEVKQSGVTRVEDLINQLPQVFADQGGNISNGATGIATVNLRGLGDVRTLALINGRRIVPGDPRQPVADINLIPGALIKRVDVLTGGASSVYGADAVAGVVNFILDTDFTGFRVDGQYSLFQHDNRANGNVRGALNARASSPGYGYPNGLVTDGGTVDATAAFGAGFDDGHGHVTAYVSYRKIDPVTQDRRDYSACTLQANSPGTIATTGRGYNCGGSATAFPANFYTGGGYVDFNGVPQAGPTLYNFAPTNYFQRPDERYSAGLFANYEVADQFKPYMEFMFMDDRTVAQIAPSGDFFNTATINCDNPLATPGLLAAAGCTDATGTGNLYIARRNVEGGGRQDDLQHTDYRLVVGAKGDLFRGISYDAYYQYGRVNFSQTYRNDFSVSRLKKATDVVTDPGTGAPVCRSVLDGTDPACVPYDVFNPARSPSAAALAYLQVPLFSRGQTTEQIASGSFTFQGKEYGIVSPLAADGFAINVGGEYRKETVNLEFDAAFKSGEGAGQGGSGQTDIAGRLKVTEGFVEAQLPLVQDQPFFQELRLNGGYRRSHYETSGIDPLSQLNSRNSFNTDTWKGEVYWTPVRDIKLRATISRAVRAPNVQELYSSPQFALDGTTDPCANQPGTGVPSAPFAQCALTGVTAAQYGNIASNPASQYNGYFSGNAQLRPEISNSFTAGVVLTPTFLRRFQATIDYFNIRLKNQISTFGADNILSNCLGGDTFYCGFVHRNPTNGSLFRPASPSVATGGYIDDFNVNAGRLSTKGIDVTLSYSQDIGNAGSLGASFVGTYLDSLITDAFGPTKFDCVGFFGAQCGTPNPEWRHKGRLTYTTPWGPSITGAWRFFSAVKNDVFSNDPDLAGSATAAGRRPGNARFDAQNYFDLALTAPVGDHFTMRVGSNNILDRQPPLNGASLGNGNTYSQVYDALGRYIYAGVTLDF